VLPVGPLTPFTRAKNSVWPLEKLVVPVPPDAVKVTGYVQ
jgi:hypothetical protein